MKNVSKILRHFWVFILLDYTVYTYLDKCAYVLKPLYFLRNKYTYKSNKCNSLNGKNEINYSG